ncbi:rRNA maturation RNase YbeY [Lachnobacterium bovis]|uniref:rRNA maturation RNase YbeY n=1 Tax=Lachnobacterium bovis TaxID=140626 RepID=UPI00047FB0EA|nr:rRNA maturation RNase YbeY [Lachnobacterium bovis]
MIFELEEMCEIPFEFDYSELAQKVINGCLEYINFPFEAEVNLTLTNNEEIHKINLEHREIDRPTDVLSFPMLDYEKPGDFSFLEEGNFDAYDYDTDAVILGDIVISYEKVLEQANEYGHSIQREFAFLICHSMLHLFGYDHMEDEERKEMERQQRIIMEKLNILR